MNQHTVDPRTGATGDLPARIAADASSHPVPLGGPDNEVIYLDYNATTPVDPRVRDTMQPYLERDFGNPSSRHRYAQAPRAAVELARQQVSALIGSTPEEIVFTGSGSEANALAILGTVLAAARSRSARPRVVTQATEHPAVLAACRFARDFHGADIVTLPVDARGQVEPAALRQALAVQATSTTLVSIMHANNETGTIQPVAELAAIAQEHGALFHTDAAQSAGKVAIDVAQLGVDLLTVVGHKLYAPKGVAALYVRRGVSLVPLIGGGGQEHGLRAGTENVPHVVGLGAAAALAAADLDNGAPQGQQRLRDLLHSDLQRLMPGRVHLNGHPVHRLPQTLNVSLSGIRTPDLLAACPDLAASAGSACHAGRHEPSGVLTAMGLDDGRALAALRLSLGRWTIEHDVTTAASHIRRAYQGLEGPTAADG